jgi:hypothetical protein
MRLYLIIHVKRCQDKNMTCHGNPRPTNYIFHPFLPSSSQVTFSYRILIISLVLKTFGSHRLYTFLPGYFVLSDLFFRIFCFLKWDVSVYLLFWFHSTPVSLPYIGDVIKSGCTTFIALQESYVSESSCNNSTFYYIFLSPYHIFT